MVTFDFQNFFIRKRVWSNGSFEKKIGDTQSLVFSGTTIKDEIGWIGWIQQVIEFKNPEWLEWLNSTRKCMVEMVEFNQFLRFSWSSMAPLKLA